MIWHNLLSVVDTVQIEIYCVVCGGNVTDRDILILIVVKMLQYTVLLVVETLQTLIYLYCILSVGDKV